MNYSFIKTRKMHEPPKKSAFIYAVSTLLITILIFSGCSQSLNYDALDSAGATPDNEISMWLYPIGDFSNPDKVKGFIRDFNKKYPDIKVNVEYLDYATGDDRINAAISVGTTPDIVMEGPERIVAGWGADGLMADLSDMWSEDFKKDIAYGSDNVENACKSSDGSYYEYPICATAHCMAVNYEVFEQAGALKYLDLDNHTWTTDDFRAACRAISESGLVKTPGVVYCGGQGGDQGTRSLVTNFFGASFTDEKNTKYTIDSPEGAKALNLILEMTNEGSLSYDTTIQAAEELKLFAEGKTAMTFAWNSANARHYGINAKFNMFPMAFPTNQEQPSLCSGIWGFGVFDNGNAAKIENAKKLIDFLCNDEHQAPKSVRATGFFPVRSSLGDVYKGTNIEDMMHPFSQLIRFTGNYYSNTPGWTAQRNFWWMMLEKIFSGERIDKALSIYSDLANGVHSSFNAANGNHEKKNSSRVLFISSSSLGEPGVDAKIDGIRETLSNDAYMHCEFMDSNSVSGDAFIEKFYKYISDKYQKIGNIGAVLVSGDNALKMVIRYQNGFFSGIPIVYSSVNSYSLAKIADSLGIQGVETVNTVLPNIDLACKLKPDIKKIYVISDNSSSGKALSAYVEGIKSRYAPRKVIIIDTSLRNNSEIKSALSSIKEDSIVLYMAFTTDSTGRAYRYDQAVKLVTNHAEVPVFSLIWLGNDTVGSISVDYANIGRQVGYLANISLGMDNSDGEVNLRNRKYTVSSFDVRTMKKFKLSRWHLPRGTVLYNGMSITEIMLYVMATLVAILVGFALLMLFYRAESRRRKENERRLEEKNKQIQQESEVDALTGLGNRRAFDRHLEKSTVSGRSFSLLLIDLDKFKSINDTYGHLVGDTVLKETGNRLLSLKERAFVPYRYGGDEFAALYFYTDLSDVSKKSQEVLSLFDAAIATDAGDINLNISLGSSDFPLDASTPEELVLSSDKALYYVKGNGRNSFKRFSEISPDSDELATL